MSTRRFIAVSVTLLLSLPAGVAHAYVINSVHGLLAFPVLACLAWALSARFDPAA